MSLPRKSPKTRASSAVLVLTMALLALTLPLNGHAAALTIEDGVVIKFGSAAQLVVRDRLVPGKGITLTSQKDDSVGGQTGLSPQTAAAGDWHGLRIEKTAAASGALTLENLTVRYAGAAGTSLAAIVLRGWSPSLEYLQLTDNVVGLSLLGAAQPAIAGSSFLRNTIGILSDGDSAPSITNSQLVGNTVLAIDNQTPATLIQATGNWWGHSSGPKETSVNPQGLGDAVSSGVNYGSYLAAAPMLNPSVRLAAPADSYEQHAVVLDIACVNASDYRIAEGNAFAGMVFQPLTDGRGQVVFATSDGDGRKNINVQFRDVVGTIITTSLNGGALIDTQAPLVTLINPSPGSVINQPIILEAVATDGSGVKQIQFYLDGGLLTTRLTAPFTYNWNTSDSTNGEHTIKVVATDEAGRTSEQSVIVTLSNVPPAPDTEGPALANISANGLALVDGATFVHSAPLTLLATDRSGISRIEVLLDNSLVATASLVNSGHSSYAALLNLDSVANGLHTLTFRAVDSLTNVTINSYAISVAHGGPAVPSLSQPTNGLTTRTAAQSVSGSAKPNSSVQILLNGQPAGAPITAGNDGRFVGSITLVSGANQIQATAGDQYGVSAASNVTVVTLDLSVPASPSGLTAMAQAAGVVHLTWMRSTDPNASGYDIYRAQTAFTSISEAVKINSSPLIGNAFEDLPPQDSPWAYRVVAVNSMGTVSSPTNVAQAVSDSLAPRALSIVYTPLGKTDVLTGRIGQGRVNLVLTTSEVLQLTPYLSIVPQGGAPIPMDIIKTGDTTYAGSFLIDANTPPGIANVLFSARDAVGNRGTDINVGGTLKIDTGGPVLSGIALTPLAPIKNDVAQLIQATFTYSKALTTAPQIKYLLSGQVRTAQLLTGLTLVNSTTYKASFTLPSDAGLASPEVLSFSSQAQDDLDNISSKVLAFNRFQVYQGNLPPLDIPLGLSAKAQPAGKVKLAWQAVDEANGYQLYRMAPGQAELQLLTRVSGADYIDQTPQDGAYKYAVATVRQSNDQESVSGQSASVDVQSSATAPGAPQNLTLQLTGQGIYASWQPPLASTLDYYNLYRASGTSITSIEGLSPLKTRIKNPETFDTNPSPLQGAYVVTAVDAAGNESAISNSAYLNASLLPVRNLKIEQIGNDLPVITWTAPNGNLAGYLVYVGPEAAKTKITENLIVSTSFTDTGYTSGERRYTVSAVDASNVEIPRSLTLPAMTMQIVSGLPIKRGVMNKLLVQVSNTSAMSLDGIRAVVRLPINKEATQFKDHKSDVFTLLSNETRFISVVVGGYAGLPGAPQAQVGVEIASNEGEMIKIARNETVDVTEGSLVVGMATEEFTRGGTGKLKLTIENTSEIDIELLTATNNGTNESSELRFKILDADGNVLASQPYKQVFGANVVTLTNGQTVARIPAGSNYVSDIFSLNVPSSSPSSIRVKLEVDTLRYHSGQDDELQITGRGSEKLVSLLDTAYIGEVTDVTPLSSFGDQDVIITGRALDRSSHVPSPNTLLKLILNQQGFERSFSVITDALGGFTYTFKPTITDSGLYKVSAVHPEITDRPEQKAFTINRVTITPASFKLDLPKNYSYSIPFVAKAGPGTAATNLRLTLDAASQITGQLPAGVSIQLPGPVTLVERQALNVPVVFATNNEALSSGSVILNVLSDEHANTPIGQVKVDYTLSDAKPYLTSSPTYIETGMAQGGSQIESVTLQNQGLQEAVNLQFLLTKADGAPPQNWAGIVSAADGTLAVGASRSVDLSFNPPADVAEGVYEFKLLVSGDNLLQQSINVYVSVTQSGQGNILFKAADIYTATVGRDGQLILGLTGATVSIQNEDVPTVMQEIVTDAVGEALFQNLPAGRYQFRAKASNHQEVGGRLIVKPGITASQSVFLNYNVITIEWSVREVALQDRYDITINTTFETDVPTAVVVLQPASINLPKMNAGDVYYGELVLTNFGLVRADNVQQKLPKNDAYYRYEFLVDIPTTLESKQRITIPYRVIALQPLEVAANDGSASGGGCFNYSTTYSVTCQSTCANGAITSCGASTSWISVSNSTCPTNPQNPLNTLRVTPPDRGSEGGGGGPSTTLPSKGKCVFIAKGGRQCH